MPLRRVLNNNLIGAKMIKKHWKQAEKLKNTPLGCGSRGFESRHSDQNPLKSVDFRGFFSLSRNPAAHQAAAGFLAHITGKRREKQQRKCSFHFQLASFFRFMAANLSFTQFVTWAKPLYCV